jgi:hypothetical protein
MVLARRSNYLSVPSEQGRKIWPVVRVASGNFLEMYDFQIFAYYATAIAATFFLAETNTHR